MKILKGKPHKRFNLKRKKGMTMNGNSLRNEIKFCILHEHLRRMKACGNSRVLDVMQVIRNKSFEELHILGLN